MRPNCKRINRGACTAPPTNNLESRLPGPEHRKYPSKPDRRKPTMTHWKVPRLDRRRWKRKLPRTLNPEVEKPQTLNLEMITRRKVDESITPY